MSRTADLVKLLAKLRTLDEPPRKTRTRRQKNNPRRIVPESVYLYKKVSTFPYQLRKEHDFLLAQDLDEIYERQVDEKKEGYFQESKLKLINENLAWFKEIRRQLAEIADYSIHGHLTECLKGNDCFCEGYDPDYTKDDIEKVLSSMMFNLALLNKPMLVNAVYRYTIKLVRDFNK